MGKLQVASELWSVVGVGRHLGIKLFDSTRGSLDWGY
jgi:hypothetical protein